MVLARDSWGSRYRYSLVAFASLACCRDSDLQGVQRLTTPIPFLQIYRVAEVALAIDGEQHGEVGFSSIHSDGYLRAKKEGTRFPLAFQQRLLPYRT
jgi:hypothetical protein